MINKNGTGTGYTTMASDSHHPLIERLHPRDENEDYYAILGCDRTATVSIDFTSRCTRLYFGHCTMYYSGGADHRGVQGASQTLSS